MAYDPKDGVVVAHMGGYSNAKPATYHYVIAKNAWSRVPDSPEMPNGYDGGTVFGCAPAAGVCLLVDGTAKDGAVWAYNVKEQKWTKLAPQGPPPPKDGKAMGYFDPARNVLVVHTRGNPPWVYRFKKTEPQPGK